MCESAFTVNGWAERLSAAAERRNVGYFGETLQFVAEGAVKWAQSEGTNALCVVRNEYMPRSKRQSTYFLTLKVKTKDGKYSVSAWQ
jgi:hypothetical protein